MSKAKKSEEEQRKAWREKKRRQREKLKKDTEKMEEMRAKDRVRKKQEREVKMKCATSAELEAMRKKKREEMKRYREKVRTQKAMSTLPESVNRQRAGKDIMKRKKNREQMKNNRATARAQKLFRQKEVSRVQKYRMRIKLKEAEEKHREGPNDGNSLDIPLSSAFTTPKASWRATKKVKNVMPETPLKKVEIIEKLTESPRCKQLLQRRGLLMTQEEKDKINVGEAVITTVASAMRETTKKGTSQKDKSHGHRILKRTMLETLKMMREKRTRAFLKEKLVIRKRKDQEAKNGQAWWKPVHRKPRKDRVTEEIQDRVATFYQESEISREVPEKSAAITVDGKLTYKCYLTCTLKEAYQAYSRQYPEDKIGFSMFKKLRPRNVKRISETNRKTCLCQTCANACLKAEALQKFCLNSDLDEVKNCAKSVILSKREMSAITLCTYNKSPKPECLKRQCQTCGTKSIDQKYAAIINRSGDSVITWYQWGPMNLTKNGKVKRIISCQARSGPMKEFTSQYKKDLETLAEHLFRAEWQHNAMTDCISSIKTQNEAVLVMDFAESYQCLFRDEVQSAFFDQNTVTIHPMMAYYLDNDGTMIKHAIIGISDCDYKDADLVLRFEKAAVDIIKHKIPDLHMLYEFTDGCAAQYKAKKAFYDVSMNTTITVTRNFFETSHGKSVCDGLGSTVKRSAYNAVLSGKYVIATAKQFHDYCQDQLNTEFTRMEQNGKACISKREFVFSSHDEAYSRPELKTLKGTRSLHAIQSTAKPLRLKTRTLSCFCDGCKGLKDSCSNEIYVEDWETRELCTSTTSTPHDQQEPDNEQEQEQQQDQQQGLDEDSDTVTVDFDALTTGVYVKARVRSQKRQQSRHQDFVAEVVMTEPEVRIRYWQRYGRSVKNWLWPEEDAPSFPLEEDDLVKVLGNPQPSSSGRRLHFIFEDFD